VMGEGSQAEEQNQCEKSVRHNGGTIRSLYSNGKSIVSIQGIQSADTS